MIDIEKAKQFSTLLDGLLNPNEDIRIQAENSVMEQINKDYISTYCYSIYKMKSKVYFWGLSKAKMIRTAENWGLSSRRTSAKRSEI